MSWQIWYFPYDGRTRAQVLAPEWVAKRLGWGPRLFDDARERATEIAPGVRIMPVYTGQSVLPHGTIGDGVYVAVWTEGDDGQ